MFKNLEKQVKTTQSAGFSELYRKWTKAVAWNAEKRAKGVDISKHMPRYYKLESQVDRLWAVMNEQEQKDIVDELCETGELTEKIKDILKLFSGQYPARIVDITA